MNRGELQYNQERITYLQKILSENRKDHLLLKCCYFDEPTQRYDEMAISEAMEKYTLDLAEAIASLGIDIYNFSKNDSVVLTRRGKRTLEMETL